MTESWLMKLASYAFGKGRVRSSQKAITYTYTVDTSRRPKRCSSRLRSSCSSSAGTLSSRESSSRSESTILPNEIRPGYVIVYAGSQRKKFIIPSGILNHSLFKLLLDKFDRSDDDDNHGCRDFIDDETGACAILLSCEAEFLHRLLFLIESGGDANQEMRWDELKKFLESNNGGQ